MISSINPPPNPHAWDISNSDKVKGMSCLDMGLKIECIHQHNALMFLQY